MNDYTKYHSGLPIERLVEIAYFDRKNIVKEARKSARLTIEKKGVSPEKIKLIKASIRKRKNIERSERLRNKNDSYSFWDFFRDGVSESIF